MIGKTNAAPKTGGESPIEYLGEHYSDGGVLTFTCPACSVIVAIAEDGVIFGAVCGYGAGMLEGSNYWAASRVTSQTGHPEYGIVDITSGSSSGEYQISWAIDGEGLFGDCPYQVYCI